MRALPAQETLDRLKGVKLGAVVGWQATAMVQAIDDEGLSLEMSNGMDGQVHLGISSSPSREGRGAPGADRKVDFRLVLFSDTNQYSGFPPR